MSARRTGLFVAFEGGEGAGKSTQVRALASALTARGVDVVSTREPGATVVGSAIRSVLFLPGAEGLAPRAELMLYAADRAQHVAKVIRPALDAGKVVITDRFSGSTLAYQAGARGLDTRMVEQVSSWASDGLYPHLTFFLDGDPEVLLGRAKARGDANRFEAEELAFHHAVRHSFRYQARSCSWVTVDALAPVEQVHEEIVKRAVEECGWYGHVVREDH